MPVQSRGFTLYFLAYTEEVPPSSDLYSVENREWVFQRKYTVLEIQHLHKGVAIVQRNNQEAGYAGAFTTGECAITELLMGPKN